MAIQLTDSEVKAMAQNPDVLRAIADWHDFMQDQADACDMGCHGDERRAAELRAEAERIEAEV